VELYDSATRRGDLPHFVGKSYEPDFGHCGLRGDLSGTWFAIPLSRPRVSALYQVTSTDLLARATVWAGESPAAQNELFNVTNGDTLRWQHMWPRMAKMLGMEVADPVPFSLVTYMADKRPVWDAIVKKEKLQPIPYEQMVSWGYGDFAFRQGFDNVSSTIKVRQAGFHDCLDSETMFSQFFGELREMKQVGKSHRR
jgi:hypothetical protein